MKIKHRRSSEDAAPRTAQLKTKDLEYLPDPALNAIDYAPEEIVGSAVWAELPDAHKRQLAQELDEWISGMYRVRAQNDNAINRGDYTALAPVRRLIDDWGNNLAKIIADERETFASGKKRGTRPPWLKACEKLSEGALAEPIVRALITSMAGAGLRAQAAPTVANVSSRIGRDVDIARRMAVWVEKEPGLFKAYQKRLSQAGATRKHKRKVMLHGINKKLIPTLKQEADKQELEAWNRLTTAKIGKGLLLLALPAMGGHVTLGTKEHEARKDRYKKPTKVLDLTDEAYKWIAQALRNGEIESRRARPMVCPPLPWEGRKGGGYLLGTLTSRNVMQRTWGDARRTWAMLKEGPTPTRVYAALNYLGNTKLRVRKNVLEVALEARDHGLDLPDIPVERHRIPDPIKPADIATNDKARAIYRQARARTKEANLKLASEELANEDALSEAHHFSDEPELYFPHACDFRGRMYPIPTGLHAQGSDLRRALIEFAHGKPISSADASSRWLAIQVAKTFGQDKVPFDDRIAWVFENEEMIRRIADDPLGNRQEWVKQADKKKLWQCLAACREWRDYLDHGDGFVSHLPVYVDGTCNGIQHFAAIGRCPELARMVNLAPSDTPQDIYRVVADMARALVVVAAAKMNLPDTRLAEMWRRALDASKVPLRSLAKQPVMTRPYGASGMTILDDVREKLRVEIDPNQHFISEEDEPKAVGFMMRCLNMALAQVLTKPNMVLSWLCACVEEVHRKGITGLEPGFGWTAPSGWPWGLMYGEETTKTVTVRRGKESLSTGYRDTSDKKVDIKRQKQAASPNFVHALDASAMVFAINILERGGEVGGIIAIHDAVGALAADIPYVDAAVREGFVELYTEHNPVMSFYNATLAQVRPEARHTVPAPPELGDFDIREVLRSPYFFS